MAETLVEKEDNPSAEKPNACSVTQAMNMAKRGLEQIRLTVVGEISEFSDKAGYKAAYFTIRDDECSMPCLMWRDVYRASGLQLRQGMLVQVTGCFSCYPAKGRMQFTVRKIALAGEGNLRMQVAQIAQKLQAEGLMDPSRKRRTPALPARIAVVTSPRGKAIRDVMRTLRRRYPLGELMVFGVPVEGAGAPAAMCEALVAAQQAQPAPDVILLVRGGGSYEDLMPFNDEGLARCVAASTIPVVTGIGHEPDNSIADMVADRRCSTPTAAAEAVAPSVDELRQKLKNATRMLGDAYGGQVGRLSASLEKLADRRVWDDPHYLTGGFQQTLDMQSERLVRALPATLNARRSELDLLGQRLSSAIPEGLSARSHELEIAKSRLLAAGPTIVSRAAHDVELARANLEHLGPGLTERFEREVAVGAGKLDALSPLKTLSRGYSITYAADGASVIDSADKAAPGDEIVVQLADGSLDCTVNNIEKGN